MGQVGVVSAVKIRLHGTRGECEVAAARIGQALNVVSVSEPYPDRGRSVLVRVYLEARIPVTTTFPEIPDGCH